jgi:hypothetical protein
MGNLLKLVQEKFLPNGFHWWNPLDYAAGFFGILFGISILLREKAYGYGRWYSAWWDFPAFIGSIFLTVRIGHSLAANHTVLWTTIDTFLSFVAMELFGLPILVILLNKIGKGVEHCWDAFSNFNRKYGGPFVVRFVDRLEKAPAAGWLWSHVNRENLFFKLLGYVAWLVFGVAAIASGFPAHDLVYSVFSLFLGANLAVSLASWVIGYAAVALVAGFVGTLIEDSKEEGVALTVSSLGSFLVGHYVTLPFLAAAGWSGLLVSVATYVVLGLFFTSYAFPGICALFTQGFIERLYKAVKAIVNNFYGRHEGERAGLHHLLAQATSLFATFWLLHWFLVGFVGFSMLTTFSVWVLLGILSLACFGSVLDEKGSWHDVAGVGLTLATIGGIDTALFWHNQGWIGGGIGACIGGAIAGLLIVGLLLPLAFEAVAHVTKPDGLLEEFGNSWNKVHNFLVTRGLAKVGDWCLNGYRVPFTAQDANKATADRNARIKGADSLLLQVANLISTIVLGYITWAFTGSLAEAHLGMLPAEVVQGVATALVLVFSYSVVGHEIVHWGSSFIGGVLGTITFVVCGVYMSTAQPLGWVFPWAFGIVAGLVVTGLVAAAGWRIVRGGLAFVRAGTVLPLLEEPQEFAWNHFGKKFEALRDVIVADLRAFVKAVHEFAHGISEWLRGVRSHSK